ncbi:GNAT family N-acetyltransferase [Kineosporia rhizophila]|nr:GNAT family N-acetyltransferase [Kineosporia rhizophila]
MSEDAALSAEDPADNEEIPAAMEIRATTEENFQVFVDTVHSAFARLPEAPVDGGGLWWSALEPERCLLAFTPKGKAVGTAGSYPFELTLPGERIAPAAGVTAVGVLPTHRRRGVLSAIMRHQLTDLRERGEFLSVLLASEAGIYGRFGYGTATYEAELTVRRHENAFAPPRAGGTDPNRGSIELLPSAECLPILEDVYDRYRRQQPGALSRPHRWWSLRAGQPPIAPQPRLIALHRDADGLADGYASYARGEGSSLKVDEIVAPSDQVFTTLARYLLDHDLFTSMVFRHVPPEHPLRWQLADLRAGRVGKVTDWLWVRLLDIPRALTARGWFDDGELVLDVHDPFLEKQGRYRLHVRDGKAECEPTDLPPDLTLDVRDLGAIYLGGTTPSTLVRAGHIQSHTDDAAARADVLFRSDRLPHCLHWF